MARTTESTPEDQHLIEAGFDPAASPDEQLRKLGELRADDRYGAAVARSLGKIADPRAAAMLAAMESSAGGALRREVRRALFKLRQRGIEPSPEDAPARERAGAAAAEPQLTAMLSPIDSEGVRVAWLIKHRAQGGVTRLWGLADDAEGLVGANLASLTRRELRAEREELERRASMKLADADWRLADYILCEAWRATPESRRGKVGNFLTLRAELIASPPPTDFSHPIYQEFAAELANDPSLELLKEPELLEWRLPTAILKLYADEIGKAQESVIVVSSVQQQERVNLVVERAIAEILSGENASRIRRRFEDIAWFLARREARREAGWAAAAAVRIRDGADLKRIPFFQAFIRTQIGTIAAAEERKAQREPRLIMTPAEAMRAREAQMRRRGI